MSRERWVVVGVPPQRRYGWEIRAQRIFEAMARRIDAAVVHRPSLRVLMHLGCRSPDRLLPGVAIASTHLLPRLALDIAQRFVRLEVFDLHDHPVLQQDALGFPFPPRARRELDHLVAANLAAFGRVAVPTLSLAEVAGVSAEQRVILSNGTDTDAIRPGPWPSSPVIAMVSGGAPGRGIETLIESVRLLRLQHPDATLRLALAPTDPASAAYVSRLGRAAHSVAWLSVDTIPNARIGAFMAEAMVLVVPHPPHPYMDLALPVKLFDAMAAGRPLCVTPRTETVRVIEGAAAGEIAGSDRPEDLAHALNALLANERRALRLGANGRKAAETRFDWSILSADMADAVLGPVR